MSNTNKAAKNPKSNKQRCLPGGGFLSESPNCQGYGGPKCDVEARVFKHNHHPKDKTEVALERHHASFQHPFFTTLREFVMCEIFPLKLIPDSNPAPYRGQGFHLLWSLSRQTVVGLTMYSTVMIGK
ncbi:uncharacterized protein LOC120429095 [Culex pipiens pallens]|uniref:uncharacterized protein LOC120429095 n=1 Tax=Culex pipiens pallens TaxID=42434 RepID=UPI001953E7F2|nr:uncharacterized protein LOC120429095 [Culex pipiens pallens]